MPINKDRAHQSVGNGNKPVNNIATYHSMNKNIGPTSMYDSSVALKNTIRRRLNTASNKGTTGPKRAQAFGIKGPKLPNDQIQVSGIKGDHSDHVYFVNLFPRMKLNHSTA